MPDESDLSYEGWRVAGAASVGVFVSFASLFVYTFGTLLKPLAEEFSWSREAVSAAFGIAAMTVAVCSPPLGMLLDRHGARRIIVPALAIFGGAFASLALLTPHLWHLYAVCVVIGIVGNATAQMAYTRTVSSWFENTPRRGPGADAVGRRRGSHGAAADRPGVDRPRGLADRVCAARRDGARRGAAWRARVRPRASVNGGGAGHDHDGATVREGLASRAFWILVVVLFCSSIAQNGAITHLSAMLTDRGVGAAGAAVAVSAMGGAALAGRLLTGWLLDRFFAARVSFALLSIAALGTWLLSWANTLPLGVAGAALVGFGMGGEGDVTPYLLSRYFGLRSFSTLYGLTWTAYAIAGGIGPVLMGQAFDVTGSYEALLVRLAVATLGVAGLMLLLPGYDSARY